MLKDGVEVEVLEASELLEEGLGDFRDLGEGEGTFLLMEVRAQCWYNRMKVPWSFCFSLKYLSDSFSRCCLSFTTIVTVLKIYITIGFGFSSRKM